MHLQYFIDSATRFAGWVKKNRRIKPKNSIVKVNIGSGFTVADGWINVDASLNAFFSNWPLFFLKMIYKASGANQHYSEYDYCKILKSYNFLHHNVEYGIPFPDESVDYLYSSHFLEHIFRTDAKGLLEDAHRVLKKGGTMRICIPDLEYAISLYNNGEREKALSFFFSDNKYGYFHHHKYMYDFELIKKMVEEIGFVNIKRCSYKQGKTPDIEVLDNRPDQTLFIEAEKF